MSYGVSYGITYYLTQGNGPNPGQIGRYSICLPWRNGRL